MGARPCVSKPAPGFLSIILKRRRTRAPRGALRCFRGELCSRPRNPGRVQTSSQERGAVRSRRRRVSRSRARGQTGPRRPELLVSAPRCKWPSEADPTSPLKWDRAAVVWTL